ncbi:MAG TPA: hypothetical protein VMW10_11005 [Alphaproteobacteria bacterium]|nr:hypothetical protein [Alphaproteobacteria bacterium]
MRILIIALLFLTVPIHADFGWFLLGTMVGGSQEKEQQTKYPERQLPGVDPIIEAGKFIDTFYTHPDYPASKYEKSIKILFDDRVNEEALLLSTYELPTFDDKGGFTGHINIENYILMKSDGEWRYNIQCLCEKEAIIKHLNRNNPNFPNFWINKEKLISFVD